MHEHGSAVTDGDPVDLRVELPRPAPLGSCRHVQMLVAIISRTKHTGLYSFSLFSAFSAIPAGTSRYSENSIENDPRP